MKGARLISVYAAFLAMFGVVMGRLYLLAGNQDYASTARAQTVTTLELPRQRGDILDVEGRSFTGLSDQWYALALPGDDSYVTLFRYVSYEDQSLLYDQAGQSAGPFLMPVDRDLTGEGVFSVCEPVREMELPIAVHILGYLDQEGHGVTGVEAAFDDLLYQPDGDILRCSTTARGSMANTDTKGAFGSAKSVPTASKTPAQRSAPQRSAALISITTRSLRRSNASMAPRKALSASTSSLTRLMKPNCGPNLSLASHRSTRLFSLTAALLSTATTRATTPDAEAELRAAPTAPSARCSRSHGEPRAAKSSAEPTARAANAAPALAHAAGRSSQPRPPSGAAPPS